MEQFTLQLDLNYQRPMVSLHNWYNFDALIDTGASFPVWTASESILKSMGAEMIKENVHFSGFGGRTKGNLYRIPKVIIGKLIFPNMAIVCCSELADVPFSIILSATIFRNLIYEIDDKNHYLTITIPDDESFVRNLHIKDKNGKLHILYGE